MTARQKILKSNIRDVAFSVMVKALITSFKLLYVRPG